MTSSSSHPRTRWVIAVRVMISIALVGAAISGINAAQGPADPAAAAPSPPAVPPIRPGIDSQSTHATSRGGTVTLSFPVGSTLDKYGNDVGLGGIWSCGSNGCVTYGMSWSIPGGTTVVSGCTGITWTCTVRYASTAVGDSTYWDMVSAVFGRGSLTVFRRQDFLLWSPPGLFFVTVRPVDAQGGPFTIPGYGPVAYAVRAGVNPTVANCVPFNWYYTPIDHRGDVSPPVSDCFTLPVDYNRNGNPDARWWAILPAGSGPWTIFPFDSAPVGSIRNATRRWSAVNIPSVTADTSLTSPLLGSSGSTTTTTTSTTPGATTTTTTVQLPGGTAPKPPVVTSAVVGDAVTGRANGKVEGAPGATVTVTLASAIGATCPRLMIGAGVTTFGTQQVVLDAQGKGTFSISGAVTANTYLYGTVTAGADLSSVGDCLTIPANVSPGAAVTSVTAAAGVGSDRVEVGNNSGFTINGYAQIDTGSQLEVRRISGFGSLIFEAPLGKAHAPGASVVAVLPPLGDTSAPTITVNVPAPDQQVTQGSRLLVSFSCTDNIVGVESCGGTLTSGTILDTSTVGSQSMIVRAWDTNGNLATATVNYTVVGAPNSIQSVAPTPVFASPSFAG